MNTRAPELSVVLAVSDPVGDLHATVAALDAGCRGMAAELLIVSDETQHAAAAGTSSFASVRHLSCAPETLAPVRWGIGAREATARVVAFTTNHMRVAPGWGPAFADAVNRTVVGAGGPIALSPDADMTTAATYFLRFSAFAPRITGDDAVKDVAGDNGAYDHDAIAAHADLLREGFWEVEFHRRFERDGLTLRMCREALSTFVGPVHFGDIMSHRYRHGAEFGMTRVIRRRESRARIVAAAPLVPFVLMLRIARRAAASGSSGKLLTAALPLFAIACAWAAGEAAGALTARRAT